jgi:hypothetical protein
MWGGGLRLREPCATKAGEGIRTLDIQLGKHNPQARVTAKVPLRHHQRGCAYRTRFICAICSSVLPYQFRTGHACENGLDFTVRCDIMRLAGFHSGGSGRQHDLQVHR